MDIQLFTFLVLFYAAVYVVLSLAKDSAGVRYGFATMARMWIYAIPYLTSAAIEFTVKGEHGGFETVTLSYSTWFLITLPIAMVADNIRRKRSLANQSTDPTLASGTPLAGPESRHP